ncbi:hypothetical protein BJ742DRAFT_734696 [Cladochytrium replicatum]|nr:hypothetical protein BJ742DRAFT_734696 [Cladochytrium replicatum]
MCALVNKTSRTLWTLASWTNEVAPAAVAVNCTPASSTNLKLTGYSGVFQFAKLPTGIPFLVQSLMNRAVRPSTGTTCSEDKDCGDCYLRSSKVHPAYGTGLSWDESIGKWQVNDLSEPTWVESRWTFTRNRIFQVLSPTYQAVELVVGLVLTIAGILGTILSQRLLTSDLKSSDDVYSHIFGVAETLTSQCLWIMLEFPASAPRDGTGASFRREDFHRIKVALEVESGGKIGE